MQNYSIRHAMPDDAAALLDYLRIISDEPNNNIGFDSGSEIKWTVEDERALIEKLDPTNSAWFVAVSDEGQIISMGSMDGGTRRGRRHVAYLGISILDGWRGQGLGKVMMQHMIDWARGTGVIKRIELDVFAHNERGIRLYEKLGFVVEGRKRKEFLKYGEYVDGLFMALVWD